MVLLILQQKTFLWLGMGLLAVGTGFFRTAPANLLGRSYDKDDPRIDSGFTLLYMWINIGGIFALIGGGLIQKYLGWSITFLVSGIAAYIGLLFYVFFTQRSTKSR